MPEGTDSEDERYQKELRKRINESIRRAQIEEQTKAAMRQILEPEAYERLMIIRSSNEELYGQLVNLIVSLVQGNKIAGKISDAQFKALLEKLTSKRESSIEFKHK
ncbi:MAG: DNA-binding protein [Candidatus Marsarchaeota archaeon]|nr:DNA-binding protein [Candidatus Marsarchaeota archaeon]MCL5418888.1 DNA-binding protein [Candidatus Marsarchaeota archaeon]